MGENRLLGKKTTKLSVTPDYNNGGFEALSRISTLVNAIDLSPFSLLRKWIHVRSYVLRWAIWLWKSRWRRNRRGLWSTLRPRRASAKSSSRTSHFRRPWFRISRRRRPSRTARLSQSPPRSTSASPTSIESQPGRSSPESSPSTSPYTPAGEAPLAASPPGDSSAKSPSRLSLPERSQSLSRFTMDGSPSERSLKPRRRSFIWAWKPSRIRDSCSSLTENQSVALRFSRFRGISDSRFSLASSASEPLPETPIATDQGPSIKHKYNFWREIKIRGKKKWRMV